MERTDRLPAWQLLGLTPLLIVDGTFTDALALSCAVLGLLLFASHALWLLRASVSPSLRWVYAVLVLAAGNTCVGLALQAIAFASAQRLQFYLPLLGANCALLALAARAFTAENYRMLWRGAIAGGAAMTATLLALAAVRQGVAADNSLPLLFIGSGLIVALCNRLFAKPQAPVEPDPAAVRERRVRVTGPLR